MQKDFHYYATYCAAFLAGYSHEESLSIGYSAQFVDCCSRTFINKIHGPKSAATTQMQLELMDAKTDLTGLQDITRIWSSFHFLPKDLYAEKKKCSVRYKQKYRLLCDTNGPLVADTVKLAKHKSLQAVGIAMHVVADTWAHRYFVGTPSLVINNTNYHFCELLLDGDTMTERVLTFRHNPAAEDDMENGIYINSLYQNNENSIMNLGHGRAGHLPDYSFVRYKYMPAWGDYKEIIKDNPSDFYHAFCQMIEAMKYLRGLRDSFEVNRYDVDAVAPWETEVKTILAKRQLDSCADWKALGEKMSGFEIEEFDVERHLKEYISAEKKQKDDTFLGRFFIAAMAQKSMVTNKIFKSKNLLAGFSVDYAEKGFKGIKDFMKLVDEAKRGILDEEDSAR